MDKKQKRLGEILIERKLITSEQLKIALEEQGRTKEFLGAILLKRDIIKEKDLLEALSDQFNIQFVRLKNRYIDWSFVKKFSPSLILDYKCIPLEMDERSATVAVNNPLDVWVLEKAEREVRPLKLKIALATQQDIEECIQRYNRYLRGSFSKFLNTE